MKVYRNNFISAQDASIQLDIFKLLLDMHSPHYGPFYTSLQSILRDNHLAMLKAALQAKEDHVSDLKCIEAWAQDYMECLKARIGMKNWSLLCVPVKTSSQIHKGHKQFLPHTPLGVRRPYHTDEFGRPIIYFELERLNEKGYFAHHLSDSLSNLMLILSCKNNALQTSCPQTAHLCITAFMGLGLSPLLRADLETDQLDKHIFACAIFLKLKGCSLSEFLNTQGAPLSDTVKTKFKHAYSQLRANPDKINQMRIAPNPFHVPMAS